MHGTHILWVVVQSHAYLKMEGMNGLLRCVFKRQSSKLKNLRSADVLPCISYHSGAVQYIVACAMLCGVVQYIVALCNVWRCAVYCGIV